MVIKKALPSNKYPPYLSWGALALFFYSLLYCYLRVYRGFDLTDEGYYLLSFSAKKALTPSAHFGILYRFFFDNYATPIPTLRFYNILCYFITGGLFSSALYFWNKKINPEVTHLTSSLLIFIPLITLTQSEKFLTPSYNSLTLCSLLVAWSGILFFDTFIGRSKKHDVAVIFGAGLLLAVGYLICWFSKPTSTLASGILTLFFLLTYDKRTIVKLISFSSIIFLSGLCLIIATDEYSICSYIGHIFKSLEPMKVQGVSSKTFQSFAKIFELRSFRTLAPVLFLVLMFHKSTSDLFEKRQKLFVGILIAVGIAYSWTQFKNGFREQESWIALYLIFALLISIALERPGYIRSLNVTLAVKFLLLSFVPFSFAFGSGSSVLKKAPAASVFWFAIVILLLSTVSCQKKKVVHCIVTISIIIFVLAHLTMPIHSPVRQKSSLWAQNDAVSANSPLVGVRLSQANRDYFEELSRAAKKSGLEPGTPLLSLTGASPGTIYAIKMYGPVLPWISGGYKWSSNYARYVLDNMSQGEYNRMWIVTENAPRAIPAKLDLKQNELAFTIFNPYTGAKQQFWKPRGTELTSNKSRLTIYDRKARTAK